MSLIRLLQRKPDGEIVFREPTSGEVPAYAILSHTWGEEEVIYQDLKKSKDKSKVMGKAGWRKIHFCAEQAAVDGLEYFWVDTCCIDRKNAVELEAATNSIFRWCQNAARCYVYLTDVSKRDTEADDPRAWEEAFRKSRWFDRGWTLQELIAPKLVDFFSLEGERLGNKLSFESTIHEITGIPYEALRGDALSNFTMEQRRSWAERRNTTIEDDAAYDPAAYLNNLGNNFQSRYERTGDMTDLAEAIQVARQVVASTSKDHSNLAMYLNNLESRLWSRYERTRNMPDLAEAIQVARQVVASIPKDHSNLAMYLNNLESRLESRYKRTKNMTDLEEAIDVVRRAVVSTPKDHPDLASYLNNLGSRLESRYKRTKNMTDLEEAIDVVRRAVVSTPKDHPDLASYLNNLGSRLESRYKRTKNMTDLEEAIDVVRRAVVSTPKDHPDLASYLNNLGSRLESRYKQTGDITDLEEAIHIARQVVVSTPEDHPDLASRLNNLGSRLESRYERTGDMTDLEEAIQGKRVTHVEREEDIPRETEEDESSVGSMPTNKSTVSDFSRPIDHTSSLYSGYTSIESRTGHRIDHNELHSRDEQFLEDVEEEEGDGISQKSVGSFGDVASSMGESLIDSDIQKLAQSLILEVLEEDEVLNPLVRESLSKFKRDRVINNLAGFINGYCVLLSGSQPTLNQKRTIRHFRRRSRQFAGLVCENLDPSRLELQGNNSEDKSRAQHAERNARLARFLLGSFPDASPPWSERNNDGNEYDYESWSDSEGLPPVLEDIKTFLTNGEALRLFRQHFASFVAGESIREWNSMIEYRLQLQKGMDEKKALPSPLYSHQPKNAHDIIELENGQGFQVSWRCRCSRRFQARIPGSERQAAEEFCQRMDWNSKRDGLMVTHCFNLRWLEDLLWVLAPNMLSRFSFESSGNGAEAGELEAGNGPNPVEPVPNLPNHESQGIGTKTVRGLISDNTENDMVYICFFRRTSNEWRLKHAKINRNSNIDSSEIREAVYGVDSQNMDKALFLALRERIFGRWKGISWFNPMIIKGLEFWEFKLYHTAKLVRPVKRDKLPYETKYDEMESSDANAVLALGEWEYTHLTGQRLSVYKEFLDSEYLLHLLKFPEDAHSTSPVWTGLPRKIRTKLINRQPTPKIGWGFSIQHEWNSIAFTVAVCPIILVGFIMATYLSIKYEWPTSTGIALATGVVTLVTFVNTMLGAITKQKGISK